MRQHQPDELLRALWPQGDKSRLAVWAVLDCARDPKIYGALLESRLEFRCLYSGRLPRALEMVAPHLVELLPGHRLTTRLLDEGWGEAWAVFLQVEESSNLRHHLRKLLRVRDESGRALLFRFYDPRVLRAFLPTCGPEQLGQMFGPIRHWLCEDLGGQALLDFTLAGGALRRSATAVGAVVEI